MDFYPSWCIQTHISSVSCEDLHKIQQKISNIAFCQNLVDTGISIILGSAFSAMVQTFVDDLLTPLLGLVVGSRMSNWFIVLRNGSRALESATQRGKPVKYVTIEEAHRDGAVTLNVGRALESVVRFACLASAVFTFYRGEKSHDRMDLSIHMS